MKRAWIGIGSNLGDKLDYIRKALGLVDALPDTSLLRVSSVYDSEPVGNASQPRFFNAVAEVETAFEAREFLRALNDIEEEIALVESEVVALKDGIQRLLHNPVDMLLPGAIGPLLGAIVKGLVTAKK